MQTVFCVSKPTKNEDLSQVSLSSYGSNTTLSSIKNIPDLESGAFVQELGYQTSLGGNVSINQSSDVHVGDKNIYQGPVTIKQIVYPGKNKSLEEHITKRHDNHNFGFIYDECLNKCDVNFSSEPKNCELNKCNQVGSSKSQGCVWLLNKGKQNPLRVIVFVVATIITLCLVIFFIFFLNTPDNKKPYEDVDDTNEQDKTSPAEYDNDLTADTQQKSKLRIFNRIDWLAQPPTRNLTLLNTPVPYIVIHHTATENCNSHAQCILQVRIVQQFHIESRGWWDIGYNFLVGGDGAAYEGRGWSTEGAHTYGYNSKSIGVAFIGTFVNEKPPKVQIIACKKLIEKGVDLGFISKEYKILAARQLHTTESPGKALYEELKSWNHWSTTIGP